MRLIYFALGWAAGIVFAANTTARPMVFWALLSIFALVILWWNRRHHYALGLSIVLLGFGLGGLRFASTPLTSDVAQYNNAGGLTIEGVVTPEPDVRDERIDVRVEAETVTRLGATVPTSGLVLVQTPPLTNIHYGDRIAATGILVIPGQFDDFSYTDYLARSGVYSIMRETAVQILSTGQASPFYTALLDVKARARQNIISALPEPAASLLTGILLGDARGLAPEINDAFSAVGASHIIAISGFNMAILSGVVMGMLERFRIRGKKAALIGILILGAYTLLVGASASVVRAALMSSMLLIAGLIRRKTFVPTSIAFVAVLLSAANPTILWDIGFQLSLFATLGLALFATPLSRRFDALLKRIFPARTATTIGDFLAEPIVVSIAAQIATLPLIVLYFGRLSLVSLVVNLLVIPVQAPLLILGLAATIVAFIIPVVGQFLFWLDLILLSWTLVMVRLFAQIPFAQVNFRANPRVVLMFYLLILGGALMAITRPPWALSAIRWIRSRPVVTALIFSGAALATLIVALILSRPDGQLHVWMLDMGHSNAVLVQTPGGAHILVDGGRFPSRLLTALGDRLPFNDREIEVLVITQPDPFDYGALPNVLERYDVGLALVNGQSNVNPTYQELEARLADKLFTVKAGYSLDMDDGTKLEVLHPQSQPEITDDLNDATIALRLSFGEVSFLLASDLSETGQFEMLQAGQWPLATVLTLPQHATARSLASDFLRAVQPQVVVLESDPANRFGDPDPDTLAKLGTIPLFRTDQSGPIHFWTDGHKLWSSGTYTQLSSTALEKEPESKEE